MPLANLGELRTATLGPRVGDVELEAKFASEMMPLAEQRIYFGDGPLSPLRVLSMELRDDLEFTDGEAELPVDFLDKRALYWEAMPDPLSYEPPDVFYPAQRCRQGNPWPLAYTIEGETVKISPELTGNAKLLYYRRLAALEEDEDTNSILTKLPGVYLFSLQIEMYRILRNDGELAKVRQFYADALQAANRQTVVARTFGGTLKKKVGFGV